MVAAVKVDLATTGQFSKEAMLHLDHLYRVAFHLAKDQNEAQDLVQETFARSLAAYDQFKVGTNMKAWLTKILHNFFFDRYHQRNRWVSEDDSIDQKSAFRGRLAAENPGPESHVLFRELSSQITDALRKIAMDLRPVAGVVREIQGRKVLVPIYQGGVVLFSAIPFSAPKKTPHQTPPGSGVS